VAELSPRKEKREANNCIHLENQAKLLMMGRRCHGKARGATPEQESAELWTGEIRWWACCEKHTPGSEVNQESTPSVLCFSSGGKVITWFYLGVGKILKAGKIESPCFCSPFP
jgi:hypothetical protein